MKYFTPETSKKLEALDSKIKAQKEIVINQDQTKLVHAMDLAILVELQTQRMILEDYVNPH
jgi:hypothetical protein